MWILRPYLVLERLAYSGRGFIGEDFTAKFYSTDEVMFCGTSSEGFRFSSSKE